MQGDAMDTAIPSIMNKPLFRTVAFGGLAVLAIAIIALVVQGIWTGAAALTGFFAAALLFVLRERKLPTLFDAIFVLAALINAGGWAFDWYNQPGPYDEIAHFFTMFAITLSVGYLLYDEMMEGFYDHQRMFVIAIASIGIAIGALWEVAEWTADFFTPKQIVSGLGDTITDIILDSAGAFLAALLNLRGLNERKKAHVEPKE